MQVLSLSYLRARGSIYRGTLVQESVVCQFLDVIEITSSKWLTLNLISDATMSPLFFSACLTLSVTSTSFMLAVNISLSHVTCQDAGYSFISQYQQTEACIAWERAGHDEPLGRWHSFVVVTRYTRWLTNQEKLLEEVKAWTTKEAFLLSHSISDSLPSQEYELQLKPSHLG